MNLQNVLDQLRAANEKLPADDPKVSYMGPDKGPFKCSNCRYFDADGKPCAKVSDPVKAEGCCNLFES